MICFAFTFKKKNVLTHYLLRLPKIDIFKQNVIMPDINETFKHFIAIKK